VELQSVWTVGESAVQIQILPPAADGSSGGTRGGSRGSNTGDKHSWRVKQFLQPQDHIPPYQDIFRPLYHAYPTNTITDTTGGVFTAPLRLPRAVSILQRFSGGY
jgi:hypothetical protein